MEIRRPLLSTNQCQRYLCRLHTRVLTSMLCVLYLYKVHIIFRSDNPTDIYIKSGWPDLAYIPSCLNLDLQNKRYFESQIPCWNTPLVSFIDTWSFIPTKLYWLLYSDWFTSYLIRALIPYHSHLLLLLNHAVIVVTMLCWGLYGR